MYFNQMIAYEVKYTFLIRLLRRCVLNISVTAPQVVKTASLKYDAFDLMIKES